MALRCIFIIFFTFICYLSITEANEVEYKKEEGKLSVKIVNSSLTEVLREISIKTGVVIKMDSKIDRNVTLEFMDIPLEKGLEEIIRPNSYAMTFKDSIKNGKKGYSIEALYLFRNGTTGITTIEISENNSPISNAEIINVSSSSGEKIKIDNLSINSEKEIPVPLSQKISSKNNLLRRGPIKKGSP